MHGAICQIKNTRNDVKMMIHATALSRRMAVRAASRRDGALRITGDSSRIYTASHGRRACRQAHAAVCATIERLLSQFDALRFSVRLWTTGRKLGHSIAFKTAPVLPKMSASSWAQRSSSSIRSRPLRGADKRRKDPVARVTLVQDGYTQ
jgi:hypothetical protein